MTILVIAVWWFYEYQDRRSYRWVLGLMDEDCYAVDATYDEQDLPANDPKIWDCNKDIMEEPKPSYISFQTLEDENKAAFMGCQNLSYFLISEIGFGIISIIYVMETDKPKKSLFLPMGQKRGFAGTLAPLLYRRGPIY